MVGELVRRLADQIGVFGNRRRIAHGELWLYRKSSLSWWLFNRRLTRVREFFIYRIDSPLSFCGSHEVEIEK
jgi:hypothetical protein